jgi:hypothetical protein
MTFDLQMTGHNVHAQTGLKLLYKKSSLKRIKQANITSTVPQFKQKCLRKCVEWFREYHHDNGSDLPVYVGNSPQV